MNPTLDPIGIRLRKLRQDRRKSQRVLAATLHAFKVPITRDMLANWETCRSDVPARFIPFLAHALDAEVAGFLPDLNRRHVNELVHGRIAIEPRMKPGGRDRRAIVSAPHSPLRQPRGRRAASSPS